MASEQKVAPCGSHPSGLLVSYVAWLMPCPVTAMQEKLASLRGQLLDAGAWDASRHDDHALARFLRARGWDTEAAKRMWLASLAWRVAVGADGILEEQLMSPQREARLRKLYPHGLHGVDVMVGVRWTASLDTCYRLRHLFLDSAVHGHLMRPHQPLPTDEASSALTH